MSGIDPYFCALTRVVSIPTIHTVLLRAVQHFKAVDPLPKLSGKSN